MSGSCEFPPFVWKPRRGKPVTVVAVLRSADSFLMAADSLSTDMNYKFLTAKLEHLEERPICWGVAGDSALAQEFGEWLAEYRWDSASWPDLKTAGETRIAALNGKWRKLQKASGKKPDPMD